MLQYSFQCKWINLSLLSAFIFFEAKASMPEKDYRFSLQLAEKKVQKQNQLLNTSQALSSTLIKSLFGRYYQIGDHWDVAAWQINSNMMRMTNDLSQTQKTVGYGGIFHYEVLNIKGGLNPEVTLKVSQVEAYGYSIIDPKVSFLTLKMNDQLLQSEKAYSIQGNSSLVHVSADGFHSEITPLELLPLDVPEILTADRQSVTALPTLPPKIQKLAEQTKFKPNLSSSIWFEQDDFFGRPVQILWQKGDPWPSYLKTSGGIAILIHKGAL